MKFFLFLFIIIFIFNCFKGQENKGNEKFFDRKTINLFGFEEIIDKFFYSKSEILKLTVKNMHSAKNQIPYSYSTLGLCHPFNVSRPKEGITELLTGQRMSYSNYFVFMNQNETCAWCCTKNFTEKDTKIYKWLIDRRYHTTFYLDKLPSGYLTYKKSKFLKLHGNVRIPYIDYFSGIPIGYKEGKKYYLYNHFVFYIKINEKNNKYQVVDFYISAHSAKQADDQICIKYENGDIVYNEEEESLTYPNSSEVNFNYTYKTIDINSQEFDIKNFSEKYKYRIYNVLEDVKNRYHKIAEEQELTTGPIAFTYDVIFIKSNVSFSSRYDHYISLNGTYRWAGLILSYVIILVLAIGVFEILKRTVKKDIDQYNNNAVISDIIIDEHGWKQITGDVFRAPPHPNALSAFIGTGFEIFCILIVSLILCLVGYIKPEIKLKMINYIFICCITFSVISGYVSTFIYRNLGGKHWLKNCVKTALFFPTITLFVLLFINILMTFERSNASLKINQMALLCCLWFFISSPLVLVGTLLCLMRPTIKYPCKVNALPTTIGKKPWYLHLQYFSWVIGIVPFVTFFIEFVYLMKSIWTYQVYYLASFLSLSLLFSIIITSEISIIYVFINLCHGDHKWWWKSFFVSASPALYVMIYSFFYFLSLGLTRLSAIVIFFLINILITIVVALVLGSCGTLLTFWFIYYIYSKIKID